MDFNKTQRRRRLIRNYPAHDIEESIGIAKVIYEQNAGLPLQRTLLATGLGTTVNSSSFITKLAASEEYGITQGRYRSESIKITDLGMSIVAKRTNQEFHEAIRVCMLKPTLFQKLNDLLQGNPIPEKEFLNNLLIRDIGLHPDQTEEFTKIYTANTHFSSPTPTEIHTRVSPDQDTSLRHQQHDSNFYKQDKPSPQKPKQGSKQLGILYRRETRKTATYLLDFLKALQLPATIIELEDIKEGRAPSPPLVATLVIVDPTEPKSLSAYGFMIGYGAGISNGNMMILSEKTLDHNEPPYSYSNCPKIIESDPPNLALRVIAELSNSGILNIGFEQ